MNKKLSYKDLSNEDFVLIYEQEHGYLEASFSFDPFEENEEIFKEGFLTGKEKFVAVRRNNNYEIVVYGS